MRCNLLAVLLFLASAGVFADSRDGEWQLQISGHNSYLFGEPGFGGGLRIPWEVVIHFGVQDGEFRLGSGTARRLEPLRSLSQPPGWFDCRLVDGTYLDSNLVLHETPRVRFSAFPVAGAIDGGRVRLEPGYRAPGNYLAVTYECLTEETRVDNWFGLAERGKQVLGKRQDAETTVAGPRQSARVREVVGLPPDGVLELPLRDGWTFAQGAADADRLVRFTLRRVD